MNPFQEGQNPFADKPAAQINPYAPPQAPMPLQFADGNPDFAGLWRQGNLLIMHKQAPLPAICVKSNEPTPHRLTRKLQWVTMWIVLSIFFCPVIYVLLALILSKHATIHIGITKAWLQRRWQRMLIAWGIALFAFALMAFGIFSVDNNDSTSFLFLFFTGLVTLIGALIYGQVAPRMVHPAKITDTHVWLKGVHPEYLNRLPSWTA